MKLSIILLAYFACFATLVNAQTVNGELLINKTKIQQVNLQDPYVVSLFKDFKTNKHEIIFSFDGENYMNSSKSLTRFAAKKSEKPKFSFFRFKTIVKHNGKTIGTNERSPMPYIPGDMLLPAEAFDFIPILSTYQQEGFSYDKNSGKLAPGVYEITLEAIPVEVKGKISRAQFTFKI